MTLVVLDGHLHGRLLGRILEEKLQHMADGQVGDQIVEGAMALALGTTAVGLAAGGEAFDVRAAQLIGGHRQLTQQGRLTLAQGQRGGATQFEYLSRN